MIAARRIAIALVTVAPWLVAHADEAAPETPSTAASSPTAEAPPDDTSIHHWRTRCPGAAVWMDAHPDQTDTAMRQRDAARGISDPALLAEIQRRFDEDQTARRAWLENHYSPSRGEDVSRIDDDNLHWMLRLFRQQGLPTAAQIGEYGLHLTWLLVHHADSYPKFQRTALGEFKQRYEAGEVTATDFARLSDRVALRFGQPQPYGTVQYWERGGVEAQHINHLPEIDENRRAMGLMALSDYGCMMHAVRGPAPESDPR